MLVQDIINIFSKLRQQNSIDAQYSNTPSEDICIWFYLPKVIDNTD